MVHSKVQEAYDNAGYEYKKNPYDEVEARFYTWIGSNPVTRIINHITRVKVNRKEGNKEFFYYGQVLSAIDSWKNMKELSNDTVGKYEYPFFRYEYNPTTQQTSAVEIDRTVTQYELEFDENKILEMAKDFAQNVHFYVRAGAKRYPVANFHDFIDGSYEELIELGRSGKTTLAEIRTEEQIKAAEERAKIRDKKLSELGVEVEEDLKAIPNTGLNDRLAKLQDKKVTVNVKNVEETESSKQERSKIQPRN